VSEASPDGFHSVERVGTDGSIETEQWAEAPHPVVSRTEHGGRALGSSYWRAVSRFGRGLVGTRERAEGVAVGLVVVRRPVLLQLGPPEVAIDGNRIACRYPIQGGLLARRPGGSLTLSQSGDGRAELRVAVHGFHPRLGARTRPRWSGALYHQLERRLHLAISRRWLRGLTEDGLR
jgi:hypothetical protein